MNGFTEKNGILHVDDIPLPDIAQKFGTPAYVYSASTIRQQYEALSNALKKALPADRQPLLCYACKANSNIAILRLLQKMGAGLEIVSEGELFRGLKAGFSGENIISTSFGKNEHEITACLDAKIHQFNIESPDELDNIDRIATEKNVCTNVLFRLNPNIEGGGNDKIKTGRKEDKFGNTAKDIIALYEKALNKYHINPVGLSVHIGSQVFNVESFKPAFLRLGELVNTLREKGYKVERLDIGGGFPIQYHDEKLLDLDIYANFIREIILPLDTEIQMEPGRYMVGNAGILLTTAQYIKTTPSRNFLVLDAGMNDLIRPAMYDAYHEVSPVHSLKRPTHTYDIVGPICESGDLFAKNRDLEEIKAGELVAVQSSGAYGFSMASNYNSRTLPAEILVDGDKVSVIGRRQNLEDLIAREAIPDWLNV